ncbi:hypothetical protein HYU95_03455 [Candidatus Daviesbacteria bacterium]|nr:hypothetical protein [Candidatus Daviesbacteria bacterium]
MPNERGFFTPIIAFIIVAFLAATIAGFLFYKQREVSNTDQITNEVPLPPTKSYSKEITNEKPITLTGNQILEISDTHYIQKNDITLKDNAKLIIQNSFFEHLGDSSFQYWLKAYDNAQVIVENSKLRSSPWLNWNFYNSSSLTLLNVDQSESGIWHYFPDDAKVIVKNASFHGTLDNNAQADIDGSKDTFIELVFLPGSVVDESLPKTTTGTYTFPNQNDKLPGKMKLSLTNSTTPNWGITVTEEDKVTIRDTENLTVTFSFGYKFINETIELSDLKVKKYNDQTWNFKDTYLRLINTKTNKWSPIVGVDNTLIIKNSELADNAFSNTRAKIIIEDSTAQFLRAKDSVQMTVKNSTVEGDVVAEDNGRITLVNTKIGGQQVQKGNGQVINQ